MAAINQQFLKQPEVTKLTGVPRSSIYAGIKNSTFPSPIKIGARSVAWTLSSIAEWQESRIKASKAS